MSSCEARRRVLARLVGGGALPIVAAVSAAALAGCGFELRRPPTLSFRSIVLSGFAPQSPLAEALRRELSRQVRIVDDPARAEVVLEVLDDRRDRSIVASTVAAQVRELQLRVRFDFRAHAPGGRELLPRVELMLARDMSYSETLALAKAYEEAELLREMQDDIVAQVMRRLASISL